MLRVVRWLVIGLLLAAVGAYACDWAIFKLRGSPLDKVTVSHFVSAELKNNKQEIDYLGSEDVPCSVTVFPQSGYVACWYERRHRNQVTAY